MTLTITKDHFTTDKKLSEGKKFFDKFGCFLALLRPFLFSKMHFHINLPSQMT